MNKKFWFRIALTSLLVLCPTNGAWSHAEIFSDYSLEQAKEQAQKDSKMLLIDFTASWCPPCKMMEKSTWTDSAVQDWVKQNAIAIQVDVDKDPKTSKALHIEAMPTMVLFTQKNASTEFGRQVGYLEPSELLRWLDGAKAGKTPQEITKQQDESGDNVIFERLGKARELQASGKSAETFEEYIWLWNNIPAGNLSLTQMRNALLPFEMKKLIAVVPTAKDKLIALRSAAEKSGNRQDWILLNTVLSDDALTLTWFDKAKLDPKQRAGFVKLTPVLEPVLFNKSRWNDVANFLYPDSIAKINGYYKRAQEEKKPQRPDTEVAKDFDPFPSMVMTLYGAYVGAGRDDEAGKIAAECLRLDDCLAMREGLKNMEKGMRLARGTQSKTSK